MSHVSAGINMPCFTSQTETNETVLPLCRQATVLPSQRSSEISALNPDSFCCVPLTVLRLPRPCIQGIPTQLLCLVPVWDGTGSSGKVSAPSSNEPPTFPRLRRPLQILGRAFANVSISKCIWKVLRWWGGLIICVSPWPGLEERNGVVLLGLTLSPNAFTAEKLWVMTERRKTVLGRMKNVHFRG